MPLEDLGCEVFVCWFFNRFYFSLHYLGDAWIMSSDFRNAVAGYEETALWLILIFSAVFHHRVIKFAWGLLLVANYLAPLQNCLLSVSHAMLLLVL